MDSQSLAAAPATPASRADCMAAAALECDLHFRVTAVGGNHFAAGVAADGRLQKEDALDGLDESAFSGFVRPADEGARGVQFRREFTVHAVVPDSDVNEAHRMSG